ncbi:MAG: hypothetical protein CMH27_10740 [Micavibrio sp.]|nr:hypothetical protein [Micavibrio sp.]|tara:strand:+ start:502 stop:1206 length:705 start_codon:yes stop_codon:yes gene_type:complete
MPYKKTQLIQLYGIVFAALLSGCVITSGNHTTTQAHKNRMAGTNALLIIQEDAPINDSMLSWRDRASRFISFTNGEKEQKMAEKRIQSYPHAAEIAESITAPIVIQSLNLDKGTLSISYKGKDKPADITKIKSHPPQAVYILDYNIDDWSLKPNDKDKTTYWVDIDMQMKIVDVQKGAVLVQQKCYFAGEKKSFSQYALHNEDAKLLKDQITKRAQECAKQINKTLGPSLKAQI